MKKIAATTLCPCCSGSAYQNCCAPYLEGRAVPPSAEALMRSRFTAYTRDEERYLLDTWHPDTRPAELALKDGPHLKWLDLKVHEASELIDGEAFVRFTASCKVSGRFSRIEEKSRFKQEGGRWHYVDGEVNQL